MAHGGDFDKETEDLPKEPDDPVKNIVGPAFAALLAAILAGLSLLTFHLADVIGWALAGLIWLVEVIFVGWLIAKFIRYFEILGAGASAIGSRNQRAYGALREDLQKGGRPAVLYSRWLVIFLDRVDRFFGDTSSPEGTHFSRAIRLQTPAPLWTAPALYRCLQLALIYPFATIFLFWAISGHVGPAELALHLDPRLVAWQRWFAGALVLLSGTVLWAAMRARGWKRYIRVIVCIGAFVLAIALSVASAWAMTIAGPQPVSAGYLRRTAAVTTLNFVIGPRAVAITVVLVGTIAVTATIALIGALFGAIRRSSRTGAYRWEGIFLSSIILALIFVCFGAASWLSSLEIWQILGPLLLFLGFLTLLNAPFDWASLGLTRALLRRGLELGKWWPYWLGIVDAALAAVIVAVLAIAMVIGVQAFDGFTVHGGGAPVLPLGGLFDGIATHPTAPEYWWLYALLLATMIPSLFNLVIGGTSLLRGIPVLSSLLLRSIPEGEAIPIGDRFGLSLVLTGQLAIGGLLGVVVQALLVFGIIGHLLPLLGLGLLDMARDVAAFNLPARVGQLFGVSL
jgi:hypothetical protein